MRISAASALLMTIFFVFLNGAQAKTPLLVYTAVETEYLQPYKNAFESRHPDIAITYVRDSAGPIVARLLAEKDAPKADVILGVSVIALAELGNLGLLEAYTPVGADKLAKNMMDARGFWIGANAWGAALCVNPREARKLGLPIPQTWRDLTRPEYAGHIIMPHPLSSSTGYMMVYGWLRSMGEEQGWAFMEALHKNMKMYVHSGSRPAQMAAQGETLIGISSRGFAQPLLQRKAPLVIVEPKEGIAWDLEASALPKGSHHPREAKLYLDFITSDAVAEIAAGFTGIAARPEFSTEEGKRTAALFLPMDFNDAAARKSAILTEWRRRFEQ